MTRAAAPSRPARPASPPRRDRSDPDPVPDLDPDLDPDPAPDLDPVRSSASPAGRGPRPAHRPVRGGRASGRGGPEQGSGSVWVLSVAMVLSLLTGAVVVVGQASLLRHRAHAAADLAALAGAAAAEPASGSLAGAGGAVATTAAGAAAGPGLVTGGPCGAAATVARADGAELTRCTVGSDGAVSVRVAVVGTVLGGLRLTAPGTADAGPVSP